MPDPSFSAPAKIRLKDLSPQEISDLAESLGEKPFRGRQIASWLFRRGCQDFGEMTDVSKSSRQSLARLCTVGPLMTLAKDEADPGGARRLLWRLSDGLMVESVLLAEPGHLTLCVSSQVGCRMGCLFCRTGTLGLRRNLSQGEILGQIMRARRLLPEGGPSLTNVVFMGMGEPLDNADNVLRSLSLITSPDYLALASRHVTLSTVGVIPQIERIMASGGLRGGLTISLGSA
ncbi:MAG: radical SAM protein, partial [Deltaproteobacteria bacterium]|nr:radical SAM protein [Deltaproteobacteria bacterium]